MAVSASLNLLQIGRFEIASLVSGLSAPGLGRHSSGHRMARVSNTVDANVSEEDGSFREMGRRRLSKKLHFQTGKFHALSGRRSQMADIDEIDYSNIALVDLLAVQSSGVLLEGALPGNRHGQYRGVERRMIETFPDQLACGKQDTGSVGRQSLKIVYQLRAMFFGHSSVQRE